MAALQTVLQTPTAEEKDNFQFCSSIADDVWHPEKSAAAAYEWWYFDAISDDGRDALVVIFLDNFVFSPRYNAFCAQNQSQNTNKSALRDPPSAIERFPAVTFCLYRDGKPVFRAINEASAGDFAANQNFPACQIGNSRFDFEATPYGVRYLLDVNVVLRGGKRLHAALEWLIVERDFAPVKCEIKADGHFWNLASPRADVTGKIRVLSPNEKEEAEKIQFRGTGYHDHNFDSRWLPATVAEWQWGRAHFADCTAIFYLYRELNQSQPTTRLYFVKDNKLSVSDAAFSAAANTRHLFGVKYPQQLEFLTADGCSLSVRQNRIIDASFFYLRFLSEMILETPDGRRHETIGITEHLAPRSLRYRWLDWLVNMRIGKQERGAFLP
jgi:carotenoid 1,2-hydratase